MAEQNNTLGGTRFLIVAAALVIIIYGINLAQSVVALFLFSVFLALIGTPPILWLERKRVPSSLAVLIIMAGMIAFLLIIGGVVGASVSTFSDAWPVYQKRLQDQVLALKPFLANNHIIVTDKVLLEYINLGPVMSLVVGLLPGIGDCVKTLESTAYFRQISYAKARENYAIYSRNRSTTNDLVPRNG